MSIECFADEVADTYESDCEEAEWLLRDRARQNQKLTESDYAFTASRLNWDRVKTNTEFRRVSQAVTLLSIAGTPAQQEAKEAEAQAAAEVFAKESPKLEAKILELQAKLSGLERDARLTEKRVEETREALAKLPTVTPTFLRKKVGKAESLLNTEGVGANLRAATSRHQELTCILKSALFNSAESYVSSLRRLCPAAVRTIVEGPEGGNRSMRFVLSDEWPAIKSSCEREFAELNERMPELQAAYDTAMAEIKRPLIGYFFSTNEEN